MMRFLTIKQVVQATGMCKSKVYQEIRAGRFPDNILLSTITNDPKARRKVWLSTQVEDWQKKVLVANRRAV